MSLWLAAGVGLGIAYAQAEAPPQRLGLDEALRYARQHSPSIRAARAEVAEAMAMHRVARGKAGPQVSLNGFASDGNMPMILQSPMGSEPSALVMSRPDPSVDINLMLMAPIVTGGYLSGLLGAAGAQVRAAAAMAAEAEADALLAVREAYARALFEAEMVEAQRARVASAEEMLKNAQATLEAGRGIEAAVRRAEAEVAEATRELATAENSRKKSLLDLLAEMGAPMDALPELTDKLEQQALEGTVEQMVEVGNRSRGEVLAARAKVEAARGRLRSAAGASGPQLYGFAMGDAFSPKDEMGKSAGYAYGLALSFPLFDSGMRRGEVSAARAALRRAKAEAERTRIRTEREVRQAWLDAQTAQENLRTAQAAMISAQAAYEVTVIRVEAGKSILVEQLDALAALTRARANLAQATYESNLTVQRLRRAAGVLEGAR